MRERLILTLASAGVPVDTVTGSGPDVVVTYQSFATAAQRAAGAAIVAAFDWTDAAQAAWDAARAKEAANAAVDSQDALARAARAASLALMLSLQEARGKVNELVAWANAQGATLEPLVTGDSFAAAMDTVRQMIDAGYA